MRKMYVLGLGLLFFSQSLLASQEGEGTNDPVLVGSVSDAISKKPVKGVTISIVSADKVEKSFTTDASGKFSIPRLPAGEVTIVLEKKGYKTCRKEKIIVQEGKQMKLNFDLSNDQWLEDNNLFHPLLLMIQS